MTTRFDELRAELASIDREIISLMAARQRRAAEIGSVKRDAGIPTRDYRQEAEVVARARETAAAHGVSPGVAEEIMLRLIRSSLQVQEQDSIAAAGGGAGQRALVIGGAGRMGFWMVRFLDSQGYRVDVLDPAGRVEGHLSHSDLDEVALDHDIIVVAAPLRISNDILLQLAAQRPPPRGLVFDIGSLKTPLRPGLEACRDAGVSITSIHPMFGPDTELLTGRHVIFVDVGDAAARGSARQLFASTMATPIDMDVDRHDRLIAYVLGLSHALNIAFFSVLAECGEAAGELAQLSSTTFDAQLAIAAAVASESPGLYFEIQSLNAYGVHSLEALEAMVARVRTIVEAGDEAAFSALMVQGRAYLQERGPSR